MHLKGAHFWRSLTMAAVLLFSAAQLVEQSHFHGNVESKCTVCSHADGLVALVAAPLEQINVLIGHEHRVQGAFSATHAQQPRQNRSRAPPYFLS